MRNFSNTIIGYPRIGENRELKKVLESYWQGEKTFNEVNEVAKKLKRKSWEIQKEIGIEQIPSNDFSFYDHVLDTSFTFGVIPKKYNKIWNQKKVNNDLYFAMARGVQIKNNDNNLIDIPAMEMTKWFDTNYHYIVPEFEKDHKFKLLSNKVIKEYEEAKEIGIDTRPVIIGPITYLKLGKAKGNFDCIELLDNILPVYIELLKKLEEKGVSIVQFDEPFLNMDLNEKEKKAYLNCYKKIRSSIGNGLEIFLATYFDDTSINHDVLKKLPVDIIHLDILRGGVEQVKSLAQIINKNVKLSLGIVDGRNIWKNDLSKSIKIIKDISNYIEKERLVISSSCSLLHSPYNLELENGLDSDLKSWMAYAKQKLQEISIISKAVHGSYDDVRHYIENNKQSIENRKNSTKIHNQEVKNKVKSINKDFLKRKNNFKIRNKKQKEVLNLPLYPTTTIGSFPQTADVRTSRLNYKTGKISKDEYISFLKQKTKETIKIQEDIDIDVLVHGEFERSDMVEYFGEKLKGFAFSKNGWVQSYGSRCVKPPIIFGDVYRSSPMSVYWSTFAQSLTNKIVKGMLTGPVTILQWSFVRDDQSRKTTCEQIALALLDEVKDLEKAGIKIIQIDEPALREGLPLQKKDSSEYLKWAVNCFKLASSNINDKTQIHTHMCYCEFNDIIDSIAALDADVISIETSRSQMELLDVFATYKYPNEIGPGVYDIHSPRVPTCEEMKKLLKKASKTLNKEQIWVNPDCGLKTRKWPETISSLKKMVKVAKSFR